MEFEKNGKEISFLKKNIYIRNFILKYFFGTKKNKLLQDSPHPHDNACT